MIVIINVIGIAYSRYESHADMYAKANVAFFVIDSGTYEQSISIKGLTPSSAPFLYTINVYNFKGRDRSKVDLKYDIKFETTTNNGYAKALLADLLNDENVKLSNSNSSIIIHCLILYLQSHLEEI